MDIHANDISNFIVNYLSGNGEGISNYKLNSILSYMYYDFYTKEGYYIFNERPNKKLFYSVPSVYKRFYYYENDIRNVPSDFNFLSLLEDNYTFKEGYVVRHSERLMSGIDNVYFNFGVYILGVLSDLEEFDLDYITKITDDLNIN